MTSSPNESVAGELRALRTRAYGPDADIHDDPAAVQRLQELEERERAPRAKPAPALHREPEDSGRTAGRRPMVRSESPGSASQPAPEHAAQAEDPAQAARPRRWTRRRLTAVWAASLLVAAFLGASGAVLATSGARPVAELRMDGDGEWPAMLGTPRADARLFEEFLGLRIGLVPQTPHRNDRAVDCIYAVADDAMAGPVFAFGCSAGPFDATITTEVTADWPEEFRERFPVNSALRFVLDDDRVLVYTAAAEPATTPVS